jgi:DNA-directed RNA polymerase specialized sigma24 family protein
MNIPLTALYIGILNRKVTDIKRQAHKKQRIADKLENDPVVRHPTSYDPPAGLPELAKSLLRVLPERERQVFVLNEYYDMSTREIATLLGKPHGSVCPWLASARKILAHEIQRLRDAGQL